MKDQILMPKALTTENNAKALFIGEFYEEHTESCSDCDDSMSFECPHCHGDGYITAKIPVSWTTIKEIYKMAVKHFGEDYQVDNKAIHRTKTVGQSK